MRTATTARERFGTRGQEQPMKIGANKALQVTAHKAAPNLNADVGSGKIIWATARIMDLPH